MCWIKWPLKLKPVPAEGEEITPITLMSGPRESTDKVALAKILLKTWYMECSYDVPGARKVCPDREGDKEIQFKYSWSKRDEVEYLWVAADCIWRDYPVIWKPQRR